MNKIPPSRDYRIGLLKRLADTEEAAAYLSAALEENDLPVLLLALRDVADANGGLSKLAETTGLGRESLYKTLSEKGNPQLDTVARLLDALGLQLAVTAKEAA